MDKKDRLTEEIPLGEPQGVRLSRAKVRQAAKPADPNRLCLSCRRACKQESFVLIASCPRYYPGPKLKREDWKQLALPLAEPER